MNKSDISKKIHEAHGGLSHVESGEILNFILETIKYRLSCGEKVCLGGFGSFRVASRKTKRGVNPQTGKPLIINERNFVKFTPSKYLKTI